MLGFCSTPRFADHLTGPHHPERPDRIRAIYRALAEANLLPSPDPFPDFPLDLGPVRRCASPLVPIDPAPAPLEAVLAVHPPAHVEHIRHVASVGGGTLDADGDTPVAPGSFDVALLAAGAVLACCDTVMAGRVRRAFAAVRPPGHHAEPERSMGFCVLNNTAIAARHLQRHHGVARIAIVDFDVHHGNGTQACFDDDPSVLYVSLHEDPRTCYPGTGFEFEIGLGDARGTTLNLPMRPGSTDDDYLRAFDEQVIPALDNFAPQALLVSAGFDAHATDPLADIDLTEAGFERMSRALADAADRHCAGRLVSMLEGGYDLRALGRSVIAHLAGLGAA